jgi:NADPH-dependent curcumin reductase CurA
VVSKRLTIQGFIVTDKPLWDKYFKEHQEKLSAWIADGSVKARLDVTEGIDNAIKGFLAMLTGKNFGKAVIKIHDE